MKTVIEILRLSSDFLQNKGVLHPRRSAEELISFVLGCKRMDLYLQSEKPLEEPELEKIRECIRRRATKEPVEYILGKLDFYQCQIEVTKNVLIPRVETELLVDLVAKEIKKTSHDGKVLFDIGTGSGCIGISLKKVFPDLRVILSDISKEALEVAKENAKKNEVEVEWKWGDLFVPFQEKAHFIVSNPPYVSQKEYEELSEEVKHFEPKTSLLSGNSGLEYYERFAEHLPHFLYPGGKAFFEIGFSQGSDIRKIFSDPRYRTKELIADLAGLDRFFFLEIE